MNMATQDDLGEWSFEDGPMNATVPDVMLGANEQVDLPVLLDPQKLSSDVDMPADFYADGNEGEDYPMYDEYDSCEGRSEESSNSSDSDDDDDQSQISAAAYRNGTDISTIPIKREGMAVCEKCGAIGVKHAFYSKSKRFCSLACSRSYANLQREGKPIPKPQPKLKFQLPKTKPAPRPEYNTTTTKPKLDLSRSFDWLPYLKKPDFEAAPVTSFSHVPLWDCWDNITVGMKVEVENQDCDNVKNLYPKSFWIATVMKIAGYKASLRYEGFGTDGSKDFWVNLCTEAVHPVGWCATQGKPLIPPKTIQYKYADWKEFLVKRLTGARTLPTNFYQKTQEGLKSRFMPNMQLEVVDGNRISSMRVATIDEVTGGRLHVKYVGAEALDEGFWCHERSPLIHPVGWSQVVGHSIHATLDYCKRSLQKTLMKKFDENDATWDMFVQYKQPTTTLKFKEGMKLEAIDPLNLSTICVATVTKVLRNNYLMVGIDGYDTEKGSDSFCYHVSSSCIFPVGFCEINNIALTPPRGYKGEFKWFDYLKQTNSVAAPVSLFNKELPNHGFKSGMCLEAVDLMEPRLICVGTIAQVVGRLLKIHFDGWDDNYDQWCDCNSPDLYPVGWCEMVGYHLEPPRNLDLSGGKKAGRKAKGQSYKGPRKKKKKTVPMGRPKLNGKPVSAGKTSNIKETPRLPYTNAHAAAMGRQRPVVSSSSSSESDRDESGSETPSTHTPLPNLTAAEAKHEVLSIFKTTGKVIPRLVDGDQTHVAFAKPPLADTWSIADVGNFLRINDNGAYCDSFNKKKIDGKKLLVLTKEQIVNLTGMKVGPSLKIFDLIQQLKAKNKKTL